MNTHSLTPDPLGGRHHSVAATAAAYGSSSLGIRRAHTNSPTAGRPISHPSRVEREHALDSILAPGATRPVGAGDRAVEEEPDSLALCFEQDLHRSRYTPAFRRLAGKCQVFVAPQNDMLRNRLTHALEVASMATRIATSTRLCVPLAEAIALGHDCGHGPGGHAAEEALSPYLPGGFDHAYWGADVVLVPLNLTAQTLDGIRQHSWKHAAPATMEGEVVSWADRIAYVVADYNDAVRAGIVPPASLPSEVADYAGHTQESQLQFFAQAVIACTSATGQVGMFEEEAAVLDALRRHNFDRIYLRPASNIQAEKVVRVLRALTEFFIDAPGMIPAHAEAFPLSGSPEAAFSAVKYVASMTDRYAFSLATELCQFPVSDLPRSV